MAWRATCPTASTVLAVGQVARLVLMTEIVAPLVFIVESVHCWYMVFLMQMASCIPACLSLSTTFSAPSLSHSYVCLHGLLKIDDLCSTFVEHFLFSRVKRLVVSTSFLNFCVLGVSCQMFIWFHQCKTCCRSCMEFGIHSQSDYCLPLCPLDDWIG